MNTDIKNNKIMNKTKKITKWKKVIWRLSIVLLIPVLLLFLFTYMPLRWVITGHFRLDTNDVTWLSTWIDNIGL